MGLIDKSVNSKYYEIEFVPQKVTLVNASALGPIVLIYVLQCTHSITKTNDDNRSLFFFIKN